MDINTELAVMINRMNKKIEGLIGRDNAIVEVRVSPNLFDLMVIDAHRLPISMEDERNGAMRPSTFRPSDAYSFTLAGVKISPFIER